MPNITITASTADELLHVATTPGPSDLSAGTRTALIALLSPAPPPDVIVSPPGPIGPQPVPGFARVIWKEWDGVSRLKIETVAEGGWGPGCLLVIAFTAVAGAGGSASIAPWPSSNAPQTQTVSLSTKPGDFSGRFPCTRTDQGVGIQWQVGGVSRFMCVLAAGTRYFLSYKWDGPAGAADMRIQI